MLNWVRNITGVVLLGSFIRVSYSPQLFCLKSFDWCAVSTVPEHVYRQYREAVYSAHSKNEIADREPKFPLSQGRIIFSSSLTTLWNSRISLHCLGCTRYRHELSIHLHEKWRIPRRIKNCSQSDRIERCSSLSLELSPRTYSRRWVPFHPSQMSQVSSLTSLSL